MNTHVLLKDLIKDIESKEENSFNKKKSEVNLIIDDIKRIINDDANEESKFLFEKQQERERLEFLEKQRLEQLELKNIQFQMLEQQHEFDMKLNSTKENNNVITKNEEFNFINYEKLLNNMKPRNNQLKLLQNILIIGLVFNFILFYSSQKEDIPVKKSIIILPKVVKEKEEIVKKENNFDIDIFKDLNDLIFCSNIVEDKEKKSINKKKIVLNKKIIKKKKEKVDFTSNTSD